MQSHNKTTRTCIFSHQVPHYLFILQKSTQIDVSKVENGKRNIENNIVIVYNIKYSRQRRT